MKNIKKLVVLAFVLTVFYCLGYYFGLDTHGDEWFWGTVSGMLSCRISDDICTAFRNHK